MMGEDGMLRLFVAASLMLASSMALAETANDCVASKDDDRRIQGCTARIARNPKDAAAYFSRGGAYGHKGDYDHAISDYDKAIELNPHYAQAYSSRGRAFASKGDYTRAVADVTKAGELTARLGAWPAVVKAAPPKPKTATTAAPTPVAKAPAPEKPSDETSWAPWAQGKLVN